MLEFMEPDFKFDDERGEIFQLVHSGWVQTNYMTRKKGAVAGNHYHKLNREAFFIAMGAADITLRDVNTGATESHSVKRGDFFTIAPLAKHTFNFTEDTALVSFYDKGVELENGEKDIYTE
jgi:mannose-6-phosphate isomerase-like protein (cupin superfamily)